MQTLPSPSSKDTVPVNSPSSQLTVRIHRTGQRNNESSFTQGSQGTAFAPAGRESSTYENKEEADRKKKVFLRQVYTNMQRMGKRNHHYDKFSLRLKADLNNSYKRRKQTSDNDWQFGLMQSKLREQTRLTEESVHATVGTLDHTLDHMLDHNETALADANNSALSTKKRADSKNQLRLEDQSYAIQIESSRKNPNNYGSIANSDLLETQAMISVPSTIDGPSEMVVMDSNSKAGKNSIQIELKVSKDIKDP